jgi:hypothetical protein
MAKEERIAAVAGKLSRLKARHNDMGAEISELEDELAELRRPENPAKTAPSARRRAPGHADEFEDDEPADNENDDAGDDDDEPDEDDEPGEVGADK